MSDARFDLVYWVPVAPDGSVLHWLARQRRKDATMDATGYYNFFHFTTPSTDWTAMRRAGWRIVKVMMVPVEDKI